MSAQFRYTSAGIAHRDPSISSHSYIHHPDAYYEPPSSQLRLLSRDIVMSRRDANRLRRESFDYAGEMYLQANRPNDYRVVSHPSQSRSQEDVRRNSTHSRSSNSPSNSPRSPQRRSPSRSPALSPSRSPGRSPSKSPEMTEYRNSRVRDRRSSYSPHPSLYYQAEADNEQSDEAIISSTDDELDWESYPSRSRARSHSKSTRANSANASATSNDKLSSRYRARGNEESSERQRRMEYRRASLHSEVIRNNNDYSGSIQAFDSDETLRSPSPHPTNPTIQLHFGGQEVKDFNQYSQPLEDKLNGPNGPNDLPTVYSPRRRSTDRKISTGERILPKVPSAALVAPPAFSRNKSREKTKPWL